MTETSSGHQSIAYCPYCSEENLFPTEQGWECRSCLRAFNVKFLGLGSRTPPGARSGPSPTVEGASS